MTEFDTTQKAEWLDEETMGDDPVASDADPIDYPPDRPLGVHEAGVTPWGDSVGESLRHRTWREEPDVSTPGYLSPLDPEVVEEELDLGVISDPDELSAEEAALHVEQRFVVED
jgi:hypothetical protein